MKRRLLALCALTGAVVFWGTGCSLLAVPFSILEGLLSLASKLPKPPPGVFF